MSNACKYTPQGGEINIILYGTKHKVYVDIQIQVLVFLIKNRSCLFSTVYRAENARKSQEEGSGFGLLRGIGLLSYFREKDLFPFERKNMGTTFTLAQTGRSL